MFRCVGFRSGPLGRDHRNVAPRLYINKKTKVAMREGLPEPDQEVPQHGPGTSEGKGTYKRFAFKGVTTTLRFDPQRIKAEGRGKGRGSPHRSRGRGA